MSEPDNAVPRYATVNDARVWTAWPSTTGTPRALCPDLLCIRDIGEADGWRGKVVRGFFVVMRWVTGL